MDIQNDTKSRDELLLRIAGQLERWADESETGGWSTHQVKPQRELAVKLKSVVFLESCYELVL